MYVRPDKIRGTRIGLHHNIFDTLTQRYFGRENWALGLVVNSGECNNHTLYINILQSRYIT